MDQCLIEYRVRLLEDYPEAEAIWFDCWAEDEQHAIEQAFNAYDNCSIIYVATKH